MRRRQAAEGWCPAHRVVRTQRPIVQDAKGLDPGPEAGSALWTDDLNIMYAFCPGLRMQV